MDHRERNERFLGISQPQPTTTTTPSLELSEHDIFSVEPSRPEPPPPKLTTTNPYGVLAALNETQIASGRSPNRPIIFNHKANPNAAATSSSSSSSTSPVTITKRPPPRSRYVPRHPQSAPVNVPVLPRRRSILDDVVLEDDEEEAEDADEDAMKAPHEVLERRYSLVTPCSVLQGAGRTLKGRDMKQVRNAVWRRTGFLD